MLFRRGQEKKKNVPVLFCARTAGGKRYLGSINTQTARTHKHVVCVGRVSSDATSINLLMEIPGTFARPRGLNASADTSDRTGGYSEFPLKS